MEKVCTKPTGHDQVMQEPGAIHATLALITLRIERNHESCCLISGSEELGRPKQSWQLTLNVKHIHAEEQTSNKVDRSNIHACKGHMGQL